MGNILINLYFYLQKINNIFDFLLSIRYISTKYI